MRERWPLFARLRLMIARLMARGGDVPPAEDFGDPYAGTPMPRPGGHPTRHLVIALAEPDEEVESAGAVARHNGR